MKNVRLPEQITRTYFNCMEQQLMTLCYYFHNEFWKLFLGQQMVFENVIIRNVEDAIKYENSLFENAEKYYGIRFINQENLQMLNLQNGEIYLAYLDITYYPFTKHLEEDWIHCVLIYGETEEAYIVNDNFYGEEAYIFDKKLYKQGIRKLCLVECSKPMHIIRSDFEFFKESFLQMSGRQVEQWKKFILKGKVISYHPGEFTELINRMSSYIKKDAVMLERWAHEDAYLKKSVLLISNLADRLRKSFYSVLKAHLKYEVIPEEVLYQKVCDMADIFLCEDRIKREVLILLNKETGLREKLHQQVLSYLQVEELDAKNSVFEVHEKFSVMYLLNYFEKCNSLKELGYEDFEECESYLDYELIIFEKILLQELG